MKILNSSIHGVIDYIAVIFLILSPTLFELSNFISMLAYVLGAVHLTLTVFTDFKFGLIKLIPLRVHGFIELIVAIMLIVSPLILDGYSERSTDQFFFSGFGGVVLITWLITDYSSSCG